MLALGPARESERESEGEREREREWGGETRRSRATTHHLLVLVRERKFIIDNLLVRIHFSIEMIRRTGLVPWEFEFPFPGSLAPTFIIGR